MIIIITLILSMIRMKVRVLSFFYFCGKIHDNLPNQTWAWAVCAEPVDCLTTSEPDFFVIASNLVTTGQEHSTLSVNSLLDNKYNFATAKTVFKLRQIELTANLTVLCSSC